MNFNLRARLAVITLAGSLLGSGLAYAEGGRPTCGVTDSSKNFVFLFYGRGAMENCSAYRDILNDGAVLGSWQEIDTTREASMWNGLVNTHSPTIHHQCTYSWPDGGAIVAYGDGNDWPASWCQSMLNYAP